MMNDEYFSVERTSQGLYKEKGSKFISYLFPVQNKIEIESHLQHLKKDHPKSRHICYAYRLGPKSKEYRINDDGEPSGTAGRPIHNELLSAELTDVLLTVIRYFGGTKLGVSGLIHAYKISSREAITSNIKVKKYITKEFQIGFDIKEMGKVYNSLKYIDIKILGQNTGLESTVTVRIRASQSESKISTFLSHFHGLSMEHVTHDSFVSRVNIIEL